MRLAPLGPKELNRAIRRPPEIEGTVAVGSELAETLTRDLRRPTAFGMGDGYVEPGLLQLVCHRLWEEASHQSGRSMSVALYERLGGADRIAREFVWRELGRAGEHGARFTAFDRVLWSGMTRHLVVAQGIKAITDAEAMARKIRMEDLGFAGPAVAKVHLPPFDNEYLRQMPERRGDPPETLVAWISDVVGKGVDAGFIKQQHGLPGVEMERPAPLKNLFEISHDSLSDLFQRFSVEFESWVRGRWAKLAGILFGALVVLPFLLISLFTAGLLGTVVLLLEFAGGLLAYLVLIVLTVLVGEYLLGLIGYPIIRRLARGEVPLPPDRPKERSPWVTRLIAMARRVGFLPR